MLFTATREKPGTPQAVHSLGLHDGRISPSQWLMLWLRLCVRHCIYALKQARLKARSKAVAALKRNVLRTSRHALVFCERLFITVAAMRVSAQ